MKISRASLHLGILIFFILAGSVVEYYVDFRHWPAVFTIVFICPYLATLVIGLLTFIEPKSLIPIFSRTGWRQISQGFKKVAKFFYEQPEDTLIGLVACAVTSLICLFFPLASIFFMMGFTFSASIADDDYQIFPAKEN